MLRSLTLTHVIKRVVIQCTVLKALQSAFNKKTSIHLISFQNDNSKIYINKRLLVESYIHRNNKKPIIFEF